MVVPADARVDYGGSQCCVSSSRFVIASAAARSGSLFTVESLSNPSAGGELYQTTPKYRKV